MSALLAVVCTAGLLTVGFLAGAAWVTSRGPEGHVEEELARLRERLAAAQAALRADVTLPPPDRAEGQR